MSLRVLAIASLSLTTALVAAGVTPAGHGDAPDTIAARVQGCATCHGPSGEGTRDINFPRIAGKPAGYILNQLQNFRDGQRSYPPMNYLLQYLHDDYFMDMATFFAGQHIPYGPPERSTLSPDRLQAGERLVRQGDPGHAVPPCMGCHGPQLTGINPGIPGLLGLGSRYISAQLESWRAGTRRAKAPDCMFEIASRLTDTQVTEVAAWLATQPTPPTYAPAAQGAWKPVLTCGSQP